MTYVSIKIKAFATKMKFLIINRLKFLAIYTVILLINIKIINLNRKHVINITQSVCHVNFKINIFASLLYIKA